MGYPIFVVSAFFILILFRKLKLYILLSFLFLILRMFFHVQSSRYYSVFVLISFLLLGYIVRSLSCNKALFCTILCVLIAFEAIRAFNQTTNKYYYSLFDYIEKNKCDDHALLFSPLKDFNRFKSYTNSLSFDDNASSIGTILKNYFYYGHPVFILTSDTPKKHSSLIHNIYSSGLEYKHMMKTQPSSNSKKSISFYRFDTFSNSPFILSDYSYKDNNLLPGGDMEKHIDNAAVKSIVSKWVDAGASFYLNDWVLFPVSRTLVNSWDIYHDNEYPHVYLDDMTPINGKYSLHVKFMGQKQTPIYLFNKIPAGTYVLSFQLKSLDKHSLLRLYRYDYRSGRNVRPNRRNIFLLTDSNIHRYTLFFHASEFLGETSLFIISGANTEFLLDDVTCYQLNTDFLF